MSVFRNKKSQIILGAHPITKKETEKQITNMVTHNVCEEEFAGTSLVAQWIRIHLPKQGTGVPALVRNIPQAVGQVNPGAPNY